MTAMPVSDSLGGPAELLSPPYLPPAAEVAASSLPRIVLRDAAGLPLNTFTSYQKAIAESRQRLAAARAAPDEVPLGPAEWRLPHAPVPSRPDYTRTVLATDRLRRQHKKRTFADSVENGENDSNLVEALDVGIADKRHVQITSNRGTDINSREWALLCRTAETILGPMGTSLLPPDHPRPFLSRKSTVCSLPSVNVPGGIGSREGHQSWLEREGTFSTIADLRDSYEFPGFCSGCRRYTGWTFCYGCERDSEPHYHRDKTARTGGGFTYFKRDRPGHAIAKNNPLNWRVMLDYGPYVFYDDLEVPDMKKYGVAVNVERISKLEEEDESVGQSRESFLPTEIPGEPFVPQRTTTPTSVISSQRISSLGDESAEEEEQEVEEEEEEAEEEEEELEEDMGQELLPESGETDMLPPMTDDAEVVMEEASPDDSAGTGAGQKKKLYRAPAAFKLKKREGKSITSSSPFSTNRDLNVPKYGQFEIKQSDKKLTEFVEFQRGDKWNAPDPFQLRDREENPTEFKLAHRPVHEEEKPQVEFETTPVQPPSPEKSPQQTEPTVKPKKTKKTKESHPKKKERRHRSPDSGVGSVISSQQPLPPIGEVPVVGPRPAGRQPPKLKTKEPVKKDKSEAVRRVKPKEETPPRVLPPKPAHQSPEPEEIPDTPPPEFTPMTFKEIQLPAVRPYRTIEQPPLPTATLPSLPKMMEFIEPVKPLRDLSSTQLEVPPPMIEPPKQRRPPPTLKPKPKTRRFPRMPPSQMRSPGAHVPATEIRSIADPLDFLAKYCIIHPDRLPHYVRVFSRAVGEQMYRYADVPHPDGQFHDDVEDDDTSGQPNVPQDFATAEFADELLADMIDGEPVKAVLTDDERKRIQELTVVNVSLKPENALPGLNEGDQTIAKLNYTLETLMDKYEDLQRRLNETSETRVRMLADLARKQFPQVTDPNYKPPKKKGKQKKKKKSAPAEEPATVDGADAPQTIETVNKKDITPHVPKKLTDVDIVRRLDDKQLKTLSYDMELSRVNLEFERLQEKLRSVDDRIEELEDEKKLLQLFARDEFQRLETCGSKPDQFLRRQSVLYQKMHPEVNVEMNVSDLEEALREINGQLLTKNEIQYIFHILNIPGRVRVDVQLFSVIAALSEKVAQVDPFIRKLINKFDLEALNVKMDKAKELFYLLTENEVDVPLGKIAARMLAIELAAGGVSAEHTQYVLSKFNRENKGIVDFMDFLTYVPLFIEIHDRILNSPLQLDRDW